VTRYQDLDAATRRAIRRGAAAPATKAPTANDPPLGRDTATYRCHQCGALFVGFAKAERHVNAVHLGGVVQVLWAEGAKLAADTPPTEEPCPPPPPPP
jgi:hypothetical protein